MKKPPKPTEFEQFADDKCQCWACGQERQDREFEPEVRFPVCRDCWAAIPPASRLWLQLFTRHTNEGGVGLLELFEKAIADLDLIKAFGYRPGSMN